MRSRPPALILLLPILLATSSNGGKRRLPNTKGIGIDWGVFFSQVEVKQLQLFNYMYPLTFQKYHEEKKVPLVQVVDQRDEGKRRCAVLKKQKYTHEGFCSQHNSCRVGKLQYFDGSCYEKVINHHHLQTNANFSLLSMVASISMFTLLMLADNADKICG